MLYIDTPLGTGYSSAISPSHIPTNEDTVAIQLFNVLQAFFSKHPHLQSLPFFIVGESYGGKFAPGIVEYVKFHAPATPLFSLRGMGIGDGLVAPRTQVQNHADTAYVFGMLSPAEYDEITSTQNQIVKEIDAQNWHEATRLRVAMIDTLTHMGGLHTLLDVRRDSKYDANLNVQRYLDQPHVKKALHARLDVDYKECNALVETALYEDKLKDAQWKVEKILRHRVPVLLYQGQFDAQDGVASSTQWISTLKWAHHSEFEKTPKRTVVWKDRNAMLERAYDLLTHVVVRDAGHMVPHDQPDVSRHMLEKWIEKVLSTKVSTA